MSSISIKKQFLYTFIVLCAVIATFLLHEYAHWLTGEALGYSMGMTLNKAYPVKGVFLEDWHYTLVSAVGPVITLLQTIIFFFLIKRYHRQVLFPFLFSGCYVEVLSGIMNFRHANDLGRISETFHLELFTIPLIFIAIHVTLVHKTVIREGYSLGFVGWTLLLIILFSSVWILLNNRYHIVIV